MALVGKATFDESVCGCSAGALQLRVRNGKGNGTIFDTKMEPHGYPKQSPRNRIEQTSKKKVCAPGFVEPVLFKTYKIYFLINFTYSFNSSLSYSFINFLIY